LELSTLASVTTGLLIMLPFRHALLTACGNRHFQTILKIQLPSLSPRHGLLRSTLESNLWLTKYWELTRLCSLANVSRFDSWILVAASGRSCLTISFNICTITCAVAGYLHYMICFRICQHSYAKFVIWLQMPLIVLEFFTLLLVLHIQYVILILGLCQFKHNLFIFPRNCLIITNFVRCLITRVGCRTWPRNLLCFRKWTDGHFIFCRWLSSITMFTVPLCSPRWIQSSTGAWLRFLWTLRAHSFFWTTTRRVLALMAISSWHSLDYNTVCAFIPSALAYSKQLYTDEGASWLW